MKEKTYTSPTLKSIAQELGVHISTVARVLNGSEEIANKAASQETISKIKALASKRGYIPNTHASKLRSKYSNEVAVLVPQLTDFVLANIYEGIEKAADEHNYITFVSNTYDHPDRQVRLAEKAISRNVDGLIIADTHLQKSSHLLKQLTDRNIPFVLTNRHTENYCAITGDDTMGGRLAAEHLYSLGHKNIFIAGGQLYASTGSDRTTGFIDYYLERGISIPKENVISCAVDANAGYTLGEQLFSQASSTIPSAIFAVNDVLAIGIMSAAMKAGLVIGNDIALVGYNDTPYAANLPIPLTTIQSPMHEMGYQAMQSLIKKINGEEVQSLRLEPKLIIRSST